MSQKTKCTKIKKSQQKSRIRNSINYEQLLNNKMRKKTTSKKLDLKKFDKKFFNQPSLLKEKNLKRCSTSFNLQRIQAKLNGCNFITNQQENQSSRGKQTFYTILKGKNNPSKFSYPFMKCKHIKTKFRPIKVPQAPQNITRNKYTPRIRNQYLSCYDMGRSSAVSSIRKRKRGRGNRNEHINYSPYKFKNTPPKIAAFRNISSRIKKHQKKFDFKKMQLQKMEKYYSYLHLANKPKSFYSYRKKKKFNKKPKKPVKFPLRNKTAIHRSRKNPMQTQLINKKIDFDIDKQLEEQHQLVRQYEEINKYKAEYDRYPKKKKFERYCDQKEEKLDEWKKKLSQLPVENPAKRTKVQEVQCDM